jgi:hypothetical protein
LTCACAKRRPLLNGLRDLTGASRMRALEIKNGIRDRLDVVGLRSGGNVSSEKGDGGFLLFPDACRSRDTQSPGEMKQVRTSFWGCICPNAVAVRPDGNCLTGSWPPWRNPRLMIGGEAAPGVALGGQGALDPCDVRRRDKSLAVDDRAGGGRCVCALGACAIRITGCHGAVPLMASAQARWKAQVLAQSSLIITDATAQAQADRWCICWAIHCQRR